MRFRRLSNNNAINFPAGARLVQCLARLNVNFCCAGDHALSHRSVVLVMMMAVAVVVVQTMNCQFTLPDIRRMDQLRGVASRYL